MSEASEYGGMPGIIQPEVAPDPAAAEAGLGHDSRAGADYRESVQDAALVLRRAGLKDARGVIQGYEDGVVVPYDEERARADLINGQND